MAMELMTTDMVWEILSWVPATSLGPLRYVSKQWNTVISNPRFAEKQLSHFRGREKQYTLFNNISKRRSRVSCVGIDFNELDIPNLNLQLFRRWEEFVCNMVHCDGLLLLVMRQRLLVLNQLLKETRSINCGNGFDHSKDAYGFGYISNQSSYDYKMVRFRCATVYEYDYDNYIYIKEPRVEVYKFKSDSWKVVVDESFGGFDRFPISSVCLKGTPYWLGYYRAGDERFSILSIRSFDFSKERFEHLSLPTSSIRSGDSKSFGIFRGDHLSLLHRSESASRIHIWVMKQQWSKMLTIYTPEISRIHQMCLGYFNEKNGKLVVSCYYNSYHPNHKYASIYIMGENKGLRLLKYNSCMKSISSSCYYVPSLLRIPGFSRGEGEDEEDFEDGYETEYDSEEGEDDEEGFEEEEDFEDGSEEEEGSYEEEEDSEEGVSEEEEHYENV